MIPLPNVSDVRSLRRFFEEYKHLTTMEQAQLVNRNVWTIRRWKRKCGITMPCKGWGSRCKENPWPNGRKTTPKVEVERETDPKVWRTKEWLHQKYVVEGYGRHLVARMAGVSAQRILVLLKKFGIERRSTYEANKSKNPCWSKEWIEDHYVTMGLSVQECAELAGISHMTFYEWLVRYKIPVRDTFGPREIAISGRGRYRKNTKKKKQRTRPIVMSA